MIFNFHQSLEDKCQIYGSQFMIACYKRGRSQDSQARMSDKVERVLHEEEGILEVKREK